MITSVSENPLIKGYHGMFANMVHRRWGDLHVIIQKPPDFSNVKWSKAQKANRKRFREAMIYARKVLADPAMRAWYASQAKHGQTIWNVAVADYMLRPEITTTDISGYKGVKGDIIRVEAHDRYSIAAVLVFVYNALGLEVESGLATQNLSDGYWHYRTQEDNPLWKGGRIVFRVSDSPGNVVTETRPVT
jgi:hypothetical protein